MGSFFNVVANRVTKNQSIIYPSSHCEECGHVLKWYELIPIFSYLFLGGKCHKCHKKIPINCLWTELISGALFAMSYDIYGLSLELAIALIFISVLIITIISDIEYMIILDEVLIFGSILIIIFQFFSFEFKYVIYSIISAVISFGIMYLVKLLGDAIFKKESLGGGDIKLMFFFGLVFGIEKSIITIFLGTFIAFPMSLYILIAKKDNVIPFGPFLAIAAIIIFIFKIDFTKILSLLIS